MDPPSSIVKSFKYISTQQPMFSVVEPPLHYRTTSPYNNPSFQDAFHKSKENCAAADDTEISIFDAQKYFSDNTEPMKKHDVVSIPRLSSVSSTDGYGRNFRTRSFHATPTASSEASWNSQTGLLTGPSLGISLRNFDQSKKRSSVARKWIFGRKCCCSGKKSVEVKEGINSGADHSGPVMIGAVENHSSVKSEFLYAKGDSFKSQRSSITSDIHVVAGNGFPSPDPPRQQRISASGGFSFPILNNSNPVAKPGIVSQLNHPVEDMPRDSLEVFQPMHDAAAQSVRGDDDVGSDASSDLFEIESFSTQTTSYPMYRRRDSLDEAPAFNARRFVSANGGSIQFGRRSLDEPPTPSVAATECYAPSEVSIDWSVTTAEGFDKASVSNFSISASEMGSVRRRVQEEAATKKGNGGGLLLMSCRQEKAVSVGPQPVKCVAAQVGGGRPPRANKPPLASDHSARLSLAFVA